MTALGAIAARELAAYLRTPIGWIVIALYLLLAGLWMSSAIRPADPATMRPFFNGSQWLLLILAPAISMRIVSEELRAGTIEPLITAPVSDWAIILGKYFGALGFLVVMLAPTLAYAVILELVAQPDYGPMLAGYLGLLLVGALYLAVGTLCSASTPSQVVSFLATLFFFAALAFLTGPAARTIGPPADEILYALSINLRLADFARGIVDTGSIIFFIATSAWFLILAVVVMEGRRWR